MAQTRIKTWDGIIVADMGRNKGYWHTRRMQGGQQVRVQVRELGDMPGLGGIPQQLEVSSKEASASRSGRCFSCFPPKTHYYHPANQTVV
jgi:hypothetical protein